MDMDQDKAAGAELTFPRWFGYGVIFVSLIGSVWVRHGMKGWGWGLSLKQWVWLVLASTVLVALLALQRIALRRWTRWVTGDTRPFGGRFRVPRRTRSRPAA